MNEEGAERNIARRLRIPALVVIALATCGLIVYLARSPGARPPTVVGSASGTTVRAPTAPTIADATGVRISGSVIDGAGAPVTGAEVTVELERGVPADKALAIGSA
ncbi:MAG TPA: hypothetical protein VK427_02735, partial [Kofleriaceae bacterium]|nr:hypothetical protein [Kofleriaceae bacterium]